MHKNDINSTQVRSSLILLALYTHQGPNAVIGDRHTVYMRMIDIQLRLQTWENKRSRNFEGISLGKMMTSLAESYRSKQGGPDGSMIH